MQILSFLGYVQVRDLFREFRHVVRINLVQFSASELHEVSSYGHLKVQKVKIRILRRQHLLGSIDCKDCIDSIESEDGVSDPQKPS